MMRVANCQDCDPGMTRLLDQQGSGRCQRWLGKTVASVNPDKPRRDIFNLWHGMAIDPAALQRRNITWNAENPVTVRAVALGTGAVLRQHPGNVGRRAVTQKNLLQQSAQRFE